MASRTICMKKAREVIRLKTLNHSINHIHTLSKVSRTSIRYIFKRIENTTIPLKELIKLNDLDLRKIIYPVKSNLDPRHSKLIKEMPGIIEELGTNKSNLLHQWELYIIRNKDGYSYSQFCHHILLEQKKEAPGEAVFQYSFGDILFVDYAGDNIFYCGLDDIEIPVRVFVSILPASHLVYAGLSKRATSADWVEQTTRAFEYFNGVPSAVIPDCDKAVVNKADKYQAELNHQYQKLSEHYNTTVVPARPYSPRDKALVENAVNNIYRYIYPRLRDRRCYTFEELEEYFSELLEKFNKRIMRRYEKSRRELFDQHEMDHLKPLPNERYVFQKYQPSRLIGNTSHIYLKEDKNYYSVPYRFIKKKCEIYYTDRSINVFCDNELICTHIRDKTIGKYTTDYQHLSSKIKNYFEWAPYKAVQKAREYDSSVVTLVENIYKSQAHHLQARKNIYGVFNLAKKYGDKRFILACKMSIREGIYKYGVLKNILEHGLEKEEQEQMAFEYKNIAHSNIRYKSQEN